MKIGKHTTTALAFGAALGATLLAATVLATGCQDSSSSGDEGGAGGSGTGASGGVPNGAGACNEAYFKNRSAVCGLGGVDCGEAMYCEIDFDCLTCADRCVASPCQSDAECAEKHGTLCDGVEWRCESYITIGNNRCAAYDIGAPRCGNGVCEPNGQESCDSCFEDCGFCPGKTPLGQPCDSDTECLSGHCYEHSWCSTPCSTGWDCIDHTPGSNLNVWCVDTVPGNGKWCALGCADPNTGVCADFPPATCVTRKDDVDHDIEVCVIDNSPPAENSAARCEDHQDNDGDNYIDCNDKDCCDIVDCTGQPTTFCGKVENTPWSCADNLDNDGDMYFDCDDSSCCGVVDCTSFPSSYCATH